MDKILELLKGTKIDCAFPSGLLKCEITDVLYAEIVDKQAIIIVVVYIPTVKSFTATEYSLGLKCQNPNDNSIKNVIKYLDSQRGNKSIGEFIKAIIDGRKTKNLLNTVSEEVYRAIVEKDLEDMF